MIYTANGSSLHDRLFIRRRMIDLILKENEIITYNLRDYFGGSMMDFDFDIQYFDDPQKNVTLDKGNIFQLQKHYEMILSEDTPGRENLPPLRDMWVLLKEHELNTVDRTLVMFIDEVYMLKIIDFTDHKTGAAQLLFTKDLMPVFNTWFGSYASGNNSGNVDSAKEYSAYTGSLKPQDVF